MEQQKQNYPGVWIVNSKDRGRYSVKTNNKIYLGNNDIFEIELFNPTKDSVLAEIKVNGNNASENGLILRPGERFYLDCFVGDKRKFIFKTYEVENSNESLNAISNNGFVEVSFFKEKVSSNYNTYIGQLGATTNTYIDFGTNVNSYYTSTTSDNTIHYGGQLQCDTELPPLSTAWIHWAGSPTKYSDYVCENLDKKIDYSEYVSKNTDKSSKTLRSISTTETGRIEKGDKSQQKFEAVNMYFETYYINKVSYQLLPNSKKPIETTELKKNFCSNCGFKIPTNKNYKFCANCGDKL